MARPSPPALAFQDDSLLNADPVTRGRALDQMKAAGAKNLRVNAIWGQLRKGGTYDWSQMDQLVNDARSRGLAPQLTILGTPRYMTTGDQTLSWQHANPGLAGAFARDVATHFAGRVNRYSAWNEPNLQTFLADRSPKRYRQIYQAMRAGIRQASPQSQVLLGELMPGNSGSTNAQDPAMAANFLHRVFAAGDKPLRAEGLALHAYGWGGQAPGLHGGPDTYLGINQLGNAQDLLAQAKARGQLQTVTGGQVPLYLTEFGYQHRDVPNEAARARLFAAGYAAARKAGARELLSYQVTPSQAGSWDTSTRPLAIKSALRRRQG